MIPATRQFTPGPWTIYESDAHGLCVTQTNLRGPRAIIASIERGQPEAEANAQLIASAPDLYAALKALAPILDNDGPLVAAYSDVEPLVRAALAKAGA